MIVGAHFHVISVHVTFTEVEKTRNEMVLTDKCFFCLFVYGIGKIG